MAPRLRAAKETWAVENAWIRGGLVLDQAHVFVFLFPFDVRSFPGNAADTTAKIKAPFNFPGPRFLETSTSTEAWFSEGRGKEQKKKKLRKLFGLDHNATRRVLRGYLDALPPPARAVGAMDDQLMLTFEWSIDAEKVAPGP